jgi:threonine/homoserine/homoserine lactone efflux protein
MPIDSHLLGPFLLAVLLIQVTPGPGMLFILANGVAGGPRAGVAAALGAATGMVFHTAAAAAGLAAVFQAAPPIYDAVRLAGAAYLVWLAVGHFRSAGGLGEIEPAENKSSPRRVYVRSMLNNLANPKVILFFVAFLPQFVVAGAAPPIVQFVFLGVLFLLVGLLLDIPIGLLSGRIGDAVRRRDWVPRVLDRIAGTIFAGLALRLALDNERR